MEVNVKAIHFEATGKLIEFINKKADRLARRFGAITGFDVTLKVIKPETANNKDVLVLLTTDGGELVASKTADTFEEAYDKALELSSRNLKSSRKRNNSQTTPKAAAGVFRRQFIKEI